MRIDRVNSELKLHFPWYRSAGIATILIVTGVLFVFVAWNFASGSMLKILPRAFPAAFGFLGIILLTWGVALIGNSLRVSISDGSIRIKRHFLGIGHEKNIPLIQIESIEITKFGRTFPNSTLAFRLRLHTRDGRKVTITESIPGISAAEALAEELRKACGLIHQHLAVEPENKNTIVRKP